MISTTPTDRPRIQARDLSVSYGSQLILDGLDFDIAPGSFIAILGPSGCGKSTLLRCVASLVKPTSGSLTSVREVGEGTRDRVAFVFQQANLIPWRNVLANIGLPLELQNVSSADRSEQIRSAAERVGLLRDDYGKRPSMLSGGMQMRVSLARALVTDPDVLLLDEPFAALDDMLRQQLNEELLRLWQQHQWTTLFVTHNVGEAVFLSERVMVLSRRPGRITESMDVPFAYPRSPELRSSAEFAALCGRLSASLRTDRISNLDGDATSIAHPDTIARIGSSN